MTPEEMWRDHHRLAWHIAAKLGRRFSVYPDELIGTVWMLFARAAETYDPTKGKFANYAPRFVVPYAWKFLRDDSERRSCWEKGFQTTTITYSGGSADENDLKWAKNTKDIVFVDDLTARQQNAPPTEDKLDELKTAIASIPRDHWRTMARMRMEGKTLAEIGKEFNLSRERVRQVMHEAVKELRKWYKRKENEDD